MKKQDIKEFSYEVAFTEKGSGTTEILVAPCKRSAARGYGCPRTSQNSVVQPATGLSGWMLCPYPELRYACTGLSTLYAFRRMLL